MPGDFCPFGDDLRWTCAAKKFCIQFHSSKRSTANLPRTISNLSFYASGALHMAAVRRFLAAFLFALTLPLAAQQFPAEMLSGLHWRDVGPMRAGRTYAVAGNAAQPDTFYMGSVGGGVWKTQNSGRTWFPIADDPATGIPIGSIGAIAVAPSDPNIIYVGTGEPDIRSQHSYGIGVFKSTDAGKTWKSIGLEDSRQIGRIAVDPVNPNNVYVAALGHVYD